MCIDVLLPLPRRVFVVAMSFQPKLVGRIPPVGLTGLFFDSETSLFYDPISVVHGCQRSLPYTNHLNHNKFLEKNDVNEVSEPTVNGLRNQNKHEVYIPIHARSLALEKRSFFQLSSKFCVCHC